MPPEVGLATKPALATTMITRALETGTDARWVVGDEVYGVDPERFVRHPPRPALLPGPAWTNPPTDSTNDQAN